MQLISSPNRREKRPILLVRGDDMADIAFPQRQPAVILRDASAGGLLRLRDACLAASFAAAAPLSGLEAAGRGDNGSERIAAARRQRLGILAGSRPAEL
jgi:hypothetical protein